jgi:hypothetical protein
LTQNHSGKRDKKLLNAPQADPEPQRWDDHVCVYEEAFEPFTLQLARVAMAGSGLNRAHRHRTRAGTIAGLGERAPAVVERFFENLGPASGGGQPGFPARPLSARRWFCNVLPSDQRRVTQAFAPFGRFVQGSTSMQP